MARRILTPDGVFCSGCGNLASPAEGPSNQMSDGLCYSCGQPFEGEATGTRCRQCGRGVEDGEV